MSDHIGAKLTYPALLHHAAYMIGDKGYDSDEYRAALQAKGIIPWIPPRKGGCYQQASTKPFTASVTKMENMFGKAQRLATHPHAL